MVTKYLGTTKNGIKVYDRMNSHLHFEGGMTEGLLKDAIAMKYFNGRFAIFTSDFHTRIGYTTCVENREGDKIVHVCRKGRAGLTPMVMNREPVPSSKITYILMRNDDRDDVAILITAFIGDRATREPWDKSIRSEEELQRCLEFWNTHSLIFDEDLVDWDRTRLLNGDVIEQAKGA